MELIHLSSTIETFNESTTVEQFLALLNMNDWPGGWDSCEQGTDFCVYTWWLDDGYNLHAYFCDGGHVVNRFGPVGISKNRELVWQWSPNQADWNTLRGVFIRDNALQNDRG
jgi:hypothetical protein